MCVLHIVCMLAHARVQTAALTRRLPCHADEHGLKLTSNARAALMSRLAGTGQAGATGANTIPLADQAPGMVTHGGQMPHLPGPPPQPVAAAAAPQVQLSASAQALSLERGLLGPASPIPSPCLLLKNMFDPAQ